MRCPCHLTLVHLEDATPDVDDGVRALRERNDEHAAQITEVSVFCSCRTGCACAACDLIAFALLCDDRLAPERRN